jgi:hypothetical protein
MLGPKSSQFEANPMLVSALHMSFPKTSGHMQRRCLCMTEKERTRHLRHLESVSLIGNKCTSKNANNY